MLQLHQFYFCINYNNNLSFIESFWNTVKVYNYMILSWQVFTETPLHVAADMGFAECVRVLLEAGADCRVQFGSRKSTPLHLAAEDGNAACAKLLIEAGADINKVQSVMMSDAPKFMVH